MFETGYCRDDAGQCSQATGFPEPNCRFFMEIETTGDLFYFTIEGGSVEVNWGDDTWVSYTEGVVSGVQFNPNLSIPVQVRSSNEITKLFFGNRASPERSVIGIDIQQALDLVDADRMCYNLVELVDFSFSGSNNVLSFVSSWENCCNLRNFYALDISRALSIKTAWKNCGNLQNMIGLYSESCLDASGAFNGCSNMSAYGDIILENCLDFSSMFKYNHNLQIMNHIYSPSGTSFTDMFYDDRALQCILSINTLSIASSSDTHNMFHGCISSTQPNDLQQSYILDGYEWELGTACGDSSCAEGQCLDFNVWDGVSGTFVYDKFITADEQYRVSLNHGGCGSGTEVPPDYGLSCPSEEEPVCPDCTEFKVYDTQGNFDGFTTSDYDIYTTSFTHGICTGGENITPGLPQNLVASDDEELQITITWDDSLTGFPAPVYSLYRDDVLISDNNTNNMYIDQIEIGTYTYRVEAVNVIGSAYVGNSGTSLAYTSQPNSPTGFTASDNLGDAIQFTWGNSTLGSPAPTYDIYYADDTLLVSGVESGVIETAVPGTYEFYVQAINASGTADSLTDTGTALEPYKQLTVGIGGSAERFDFIVNEGADNFIVLASL